jgi:LmbE family N-acetylglucosaminyl deacetylase
MRRVARGSATASVIVPPPATGCVLAVAAHPDDLETWCAGTLARSVLAGARVVYLLLTSGDKGLRDPRPSPSQVMQLREAEQIEAARLLGVGEVYFLRQPDGELENTRDLREALVRYLRQLRPVAVFTHDPVWPDQPYVGHRDHRIAGRAVLDAVYPAARNGRFFPEHLQAGLAPHAVPEVWLFGSAAPNAWVDVAATFEVKVASRLAHASQTRDPASLRAGWRSVAAWTGAAVGLPLAEAFVVLPLG